MKRSKFPWQSPVTKSFFHLPSVHDFLWDLNATLQGDCDLVFGEDFYCLHQLADGAFVPFRNMGRCVFQGPCSIHDALIGFCLFLVICEDPGTLFLQERLLVQYFFELTAIGGRIIRGFFKQYLELLLQLSQPAVNISKAHRTAGEWDDLRFHGIRDLPNQAILVGHGRVQSGKDRLLERCFIQCG